MSLEMTDKQRAVLAMLRAGPLSTKALREQLGISVDAAHTRLRKLEDRNLIRRVQLARKEIIQWELTEQGRKALDAA